MQRRFIYFLLRTALTLASPLILIYVVVRIGRDRRYLTDLGQRLGFLPRSYHRTAPGSIWLHAVSVGEVLSAAALLRRWRDTLPATPVYVSCTTIAGRAVAREKLGPLAEGVFYAPFDFPWAVRRVLRALRPSVVVVMETEIWPNLFRETKRTGAALLVVNGRISDRTASGYARHRWFFRNVLSHADRILAQSPKDRDRYIAAGAEADKVTITGNLKYDFDPERARMPALVRDLLESACPRSVWVAASTMPPYEDDAVLEAFLQLRAKRPNLLLVLAPRKPERFDEAAAKLTALAIPFVRRTGLPGELKLPGVLLLDTVGELASIFRIADVVFMGGSIVTHGGHNILEPALFGRAIVTGPHMQNFAEIAREFDEAGAMLRVNGAADLAAAVDTLLSDAAQREELARRALGLARAKRGATEAAARETAALLQTRVPRYLPALPARIPLWLLARIWERMSRRSPAVVRKLDTPVVSVGALTIGGAGKTPFALWLAERLAREGHDPAILIRGYRRQKAAALTIIAPGETAPVAVTGDEAQLFVRTGLAVGIGANRYASGRALEESCSPSVFLLDDGFQHRRLHRDLDVVLIDCINPFGGGEVFPLGKLREPAAALERADVIVLTRVAPGRPCAEIERRLREWNSRAPIFRAYTRVRAPLPAGKVAAFCGLGNPEAFWRMLAEMGITPVCRRAFPDHHRYLASELMQFSEQAAALGAEVLLTTEKDAMNLPDDAHRLVAPLELSTVSISFEVEDGERLLRMVPVRPKVRSG